VSLSAQWTYNPDGSCTIAFTAAATTDAADGIAFFSWDFEYDASQGFRGTRMFDREGKQEYVYGQGSHWAAVKAVDEQGLESIEALKLRVNGEVKVAKGDAHNQ
jgi:hypothetical protein